MHDSILKFLGIYKLICKSSKTVYNEAYIADNDFLTLIIVQIRLNVFFCGFIHITQSNLNPNNFFYNFILYVILGITTYV